MEFKRETTIFLDDEDERFAEIVIVHEDEGVYNIRRTFVSDTHRGEGLAGMLVKEALVFIEEQGGIVKADCPYAHHVLVKKGILKD